MKLEIFFSVFYQDIKSLDTVATFTDMIKQNQTRRKNTGKQY